jgi:hypothetical protein
MVVGMFASANMVVINSYINADDKAIFTALFTNTISSKQKPDISAIHHSVSGLKLIGAPPIDAERKKVNNDVACFIIVLFNSRLYAISRNRPISKIQRLSIMHRQLLLILMAAN